MQISENRAPKDLQVSKDVAPEIYICVREEVRGAEKYQCSREQPGKGGHFPKDMMLCDVRLCPIQHTKTQLRVEFMPGRMFPKTPDCSIATSVCKYLGPGSWDLGLETWDPGPGTRSWDLGPGTWDLELETWDLGLGT